MLLLNFNPFPFLSTERLNLRRISDEDDKEIFFLRSDKEMLQFLDRDPAPDDEGADPGPDGEERWIGRDPRSQSE